MPLTWTDSVTGTTYAFDAGGVSAPTAGGAAEVQQCATIASECTKGNLIDVDWGWTCRDLVATETGATAWPVTAANPSV